MKRYFTLINLLLLCAFVAGNTYAQKHHVVRSKHKVVNKKSMHAHKPVAIVPELSIANLYPGLEFVSADSLLQFAQSLIGTPYREASSNPLYGFDCSGFVSYVFKNFNFKVPRSSSEYENAGQRINPEDAKPGDIILFTGTATHHPHSIGHIGIICNNDGGAIQFIHSTSGKEYGVTISDFNETYKRRFVKIVRLLGSNGEQSENTAGNSVTAVVGK